MNLNIDQRYSTYSASIVFYLLHHNQEYSNIWKDKYPQFVNQLDNYFKDINCGCRPPLIQFYRKNRFEIDVFTVDFINNQNLIDFDSFCEKFGGQNLRGAMFSIPNNESSYKDFLASLQVKNASFNNFQTLQFDDKILITFM